MTDLPAVRPHRGGRIALTALLLLTAGISVVVDWNDSHIFNEHWPPHAVFHDVVLLGFLSILCIGAVYLLWRRSAEPNVALATATAIPVAFWGMFFIATLVPGSSPTTHPGEPPPASFAGWAIYPNMVVATIALPWALASYITGRVKPAAPHS